MATFRRLHCLPETVRQLTTGQTRPPFELIVVNNDPAAGAEDAVRAVLPGDQRIRVTSCTTGRQGAARNHGLRLATGDYVAFVDDDDDYAPDYIEKLAGALDLGLASVRCRIQTCGMAGPDCTGQPSAAHHPLPQGTMTRREVLTPTWGDPPNEDREYWSRHPVQGAIDDTLVVICRGPGLHSPRNASQGGSWRERFVVVTRVEDTDAPVLAAFLTAFREQRYGNAQLLLDDHASNDKLRRALRKAAEQDARVRLHRGQEADRAAPPRNLFANLSGVLLAAHTSLSLGADDVIVPLSIQERLAHPGVLTRLSHIFGEHPDVWVTFGSCLTEPRTPSWPQASFPPRLWTERRFRQLPSVIGEFAPLALRAPLLQALVRQLPADAWQLPAGAHSLGSDASLQLLLYALEASGSLHAYPLADALVIKHLDARSGEAAAQRAARTEREFALRSMAPAAPIATLELNMSRTPSPPRAITVVWEGPFFTHSSLGIVNRELVAGLLDDPTLHLVPRPTMADDFTPGPESPLAALAARIRLPADAPAQIHVVHQWPPQLVPPTSGRWVVMQPWEYGGLPGAWIRSLRDQVDELWVYSEWQRQWAIASGVPAERVAVIPLGVDTDRFTPDGPRYPLATRKRIKLLAVGGIIPRKGMDVLVQAYLRAFSRDDDVCLVIKGLSTRWAYHGNQGQQDFAQLPALTETSGAAEIEFIGDTLETSDIAALYRACDVFVAPFRGEGFGLPIAEAMASALPVVVTRAGPALEICDDHTAYFVSGRAQDVPQHIVGLAPGQAGFTWTEPNAEELAQQLRQVVSHLDEARSVGACARERVRERYGRTVPAAAVRARLTALAAGEPIRHHAAAAFTPEGQRYALDDPREMVLLFHADWHAPITRSVLLALLSAFRSSDEVSLVLPLDPAQGVRVEEVAELLAELRGALSLDETECVDILLVPDEMDDALLASLYRRADRIVVAPHDHASQARAAATGRPVQHALTQDGQRN